MGLARLENLYKIGSPFAYRRTRIGGRDCIVGETSEENLVILGAGGTLRDESNYSPDDWEISRDPNTDEIIFCGTDELVNMMTIAMQTAGVSESSPKLKP